MKSATRSPAVILITGPSGAGKSTLAEKLLARKKITLRRFVTHTTRSRRTGERHGRDYWFVERNAFERDLKKNFFFEHASVYGNLYGSSKKEMTRLLAGKKQVLVIIDVQGAKTIKKLQPDSFILFIDAPQDALVRRISTRSMDPKELQRRIAKMTAEEKLRDLADVVLVNEDGKLATTVRRAESAIKRFLATRAALARA
jgi:guanylate kinase